MWQTNFYLPQSSLFPSVDLLICRSFLPFFDCNNFFLSFSLLTALEQVADDEDFLKEVLADLLTESQTAEEDLANAIANKNLDTSITIVSKVYS